jgi:hypothetical protein
MKKYGKKNPFQRAVRMTIQRRDELNVVELLERILAHGEGKTLPRKGVLTNLVRPK